MKEKRKIYSKDLGINLKSKKESELFKWLLACLLFGKPIQQNVAKRTYFEFISAKLTTPQSILKAGWDKLVKVLDKGHYVRYDYSTATKLLDVSKQLLKEYGTITRLIDKSKNTKKLSSKLQKFKGVGPKTAEIFIRDIKPIYY